MKAISKKLLVVFLATFLVLSAFLLLFRMSSVQAQSGVLFSDNFETSQPNSQFIMGDADSLTSSTSVSSPNSLQVSPSTSSASYATFINSTGQIYFQLFYATNNTGYSRILIIQGDNAWLAIYQDENGIVFDWDYNANITNVLLSPNTWYNITVSLYLDPNLGNGSFASLWLNQTLIASQNMPQVDGYYINKVIFEPSSTFQAMAYYDNIIVSTQPFSSTASPAASSSPSPSPISSPTASPSHSSSPTLSPTETAVTATPTLTPSPSPTPTIPELSFFLILLTAVASSLLISILCKKNTQHNAFSFPRSPSSMQSDSSA